MDGDEVLEILDITSKLVEENYWTSCIREWEQGILEKRDERGGKKSYMMYLLRQGYAYKGRRVQ